MEIVAIGIQSAAIARHVEVIMIMILTHQFYVVHVEEVHQMISVMV